MYRFCFVMDFAVNQRIKALLVMQMAELLETIESCVIVARHIIYASLMWR